MPDEQNVPSVSPPRPRPRRNINPATTIRIQQDENGRYSSMHLRDTYSDDHVVPKNS
jgi:hypothetical protein